MFKKILSIPLLLAGIVTVAQSPLRVERDSVKITNAELVLRNNTKDVTGYLYNTGDGKTMFRKMGRQIQFLAGTSGFPAAGDSEYQDATLANYTIKVLRNGLLQYRSNSNGVRIDDAAGKITFYPALQNNDHIYIEALGGMDLSLDGNSVNTGNPIIPQGLQLRAGVFDNADKTFTLRWTSNAKTLYLQPKVAGLGSSTLAGYGLDAPDRLGDKISLWLGNNTMGSSWNNLAVAGYTSKDVLPATQGGVAGHNIETALGLNPDFIFVSLPSNDPAANISVNQSIANLKNIDNLAQSRGIPVFFETTQPRTSYTAPQQEMLKQLADSIRNIWPNRFVEGYNDVADPAANGNILSKYDKGDGVHLNGAGNQLIAARLFDKWLEFFQSVRGVKRYVIDSSLDKTTWSQFAVEQDANIVKRSFIRYNQAKQYFRVKAELQDGSYSSFSSIATLDEKTTPTNPGVDDYNYRLLVDLGGDGATTLNGNNKVDGKPTPSPDGSGKYWNNWFGIGGVAGFTDKSSIAALKTTTNAATKMSMQIMGLPQGTFGSSDTKSINYNGFNVPVGDYPMEAVYDNVFFHSSINPNGVTLRIKGLVKTNTYYIKLWGARLDDASTTPRVLQAKLGDAAWETAQSADMRYATTGTPDYNRAITFNQIKGLDSVDIILRVGTGSTFAHLSLVDIGVMGTLPILPQLKLTDTTTSLSTMQLTAIPVNNAQVISYQWSQVSGPNTATISNGNTASANFSGLTNGTFVFKVTGTTPEGETLIAQSTVKVFPNNNGKKTLRAHFSKSAATPIPGWFNVTYPTGGTHVVATDPSTNWTIDNVSGANTYWSVLGGNQASDTEGTTTNNNSGIIPDIALKAFWFNYSLRYTPGMDNLLLKGLNPSKTYTLKLYAARNSATNTDGKPKYGVWRINGGSEQLLNALDNTSNEIVITNVTPDANGIIRLSVHSTTTTYGDFSILNALILQEN